MYFYKSKYFIFVFLIFLSFGCANNKSNDKEIVNSYEKLYFNEDLIVLAALDYEKQKKYNYSAKFFEDVYEKTKKYEYLNKSIFSYFKDKQYKKAKELIKNNLTNFKTKEYELNIVYVSALLVLDEIDEAIKISTKLDMKYKQNTGFSVVYNYLTMSKKNKMTLKFLRYYYSFSKNDALLGEIAMFVFELAKDKKSVLDKVMKNFEKAIKVEPIASYENFYGYLLIDYDIDIPKGLRLVLKASKSAPDEYSYVDSVAWGYYKSNQCKKAYKFMKKVVDKIGLKDKEVLKHWTKIKGCKK